MKATERCDRCPAQAYVMTLHGGFAMTWCIHHYMQYESFLHNNIYVDDREVLRAEQ